MQDVVAQVAEQAGSDNNDQLLQIQFTLESSNFNNKDKYKSG